MGFIQDPHRPGVLQTPRDWGRLCYTKTPGAPRWHPSCIKLCLGQESLPLGQPEAPEAQPGTGAQQSSGRPGTAFVPNGLPVTRVLRALQAGGWSLFCEGTGLFLHEI